MRSRPAVALVVAVSITVAHALSSDPSARSAAARCGSKLASRPHPSRPPVTGGASQTVGPMVGRQRTVAPAARALQLPTVLLPLPPLEVPAAAGAVGAVLPSALLVAGNMIGAGVLALPAVSLPAGLAPSLTAIVLAWVAMAASGLLIAEVMLNLRERPSSAGAGSGDVSIMSMAQSTLGQAAGFAVCATFVLLNTALLVAYISKGGEVSSLAASMALPGAAAQVPMAAWMCMFTAAVGALGSSGTSAAFDKVNSTLMVLLFGAFFVMLEALLPAVDVSLLRHANPSALPHAVPVFVCSLVYQNCVPTVVTRLDGDARLIQTAIVAGTALPTLMYCLFDVAFLGTLPPDAATSSAELAASVAAAMGANPLAAVTLPTFSLCAVVTSSLGTVTSQLEELRSLWPAAAAADGKADPGAAAPLPAGLKEPATLGLTLAPALAVGLACPGAFESALELGGLYGDLVLFGLVPAAMAWQQREQLAGASAASVRLLPGGQAALLGLGVGCGGLIASKLVSELV